MQWKASARRSTARQPGARDNRLASGLQALRRMPPDANAKAHRCFDASDTDQPSVMSQARQLQHTLRDDDGGVDRIQRT